MKKYNDFRDMSVWQKAFALLREVYKISRGSSYEAMSQILVAEAEGYITSEKSEELIIRYKDVVEELSALIRSLEK